MLDVQAQNSRVGFAGGRLAERSKERLGLTDEQLRQIKVVLKAEQTNITALLSRMREGRTGLRDAIRSVDANESSVRAASAKVASVEADFAVEHLKIFKQINPILNDEQRAKFAAMQSKLDDFSQQAISRVGARLVE